VTRCRARTAEFRWDKTNPERRRGNNLFRQIMNYRGSELVYVLLKSCGTSSFGGQMMATARLNTNRISDWKSFHEESRQAFGFPDFYGMNMNAWIDCLTYIDEGDGMSRFELGESEMLEIEVSDSEAFKSRLPEIYDALVKSSAFVNFRRVECGDRPVLSLTFL
jgi:hypothetical protein